MPTTDYTHTNNPRSIYLAEMAIPFPDWAKGQPIPSSKDMEKLASVAFADRTNRLLPVHEKEAAFFSSIDYFANAGSYPESTFDAIKEACDHFGIGSDVAPYAEFFAGVFEKQASDENVAALPGRFAISTQLNGLDYQILPLHDPYEISKSAGDLLKMVHEDRIHYLMFVDAAREIVKAATEIGSDQPLPDMVRHVGAPRFEDLTKAASLIESRRPLAKGTAGAFEAYADAIKEAAAGTITAEECMQKIAATDDLIGLRYNFNARARTLLPHDIVFGGPSYAEVEKVASENVMVRGVAVPLLSAIRNIPEIEIQYHLSKEAAADVLKTAGAVQLSHDVAKWDEKDQKTLLRLALKASDDVSKSATAVHPSGGLLERAYAAAPPRPGERMGALEAAYAAVRPTDTAPDADVRSANAKRLGITSAQAGILNDAPAGDHNKLMAGFKAPPPVVGPPAPPAFVGPPAPAK